MTTKLQKNKQLVINDMDKQTWLKKDKYGKLIKVIIMNDKINIKLVFGLHTKQNILYLYLCNNPIAFCNIHFHLLTTEYYKYSSEITLWTKDNKIICSISRNDINIIDNQIDRYNNEIDKFMEI